MDILNYVIFSTFIINIILIFTMIFIERKKPQSIISWTVVLTFLPIIGFIFYILIGGGLSYKTKKMLKIKKIYNEEYQDFIHNQKNYIKVKQAKNENIKYQDFILFNINNAQSAYLPDNKVDFFTSGKEKIEALKKDLIKAKHSINILYYIFANDKIGKEILNILIAKAKEGIRVKLAYDSVGSIRTRKTFFNKLIKAGGEVCEFFPPLFGIRLINLKMNYRNHRKIVVIDGKVGYTGGINIRDDHMGEHKRLAPWRDTHVRIEGPGVYDLQNAFFNDWRYCSKSKVKLSELTKEGYYPVNKPMGDIGVQIVTSGPESEYQQIKNAMIKMIHSAKKTIYIQSPYFVPDESFFYSLAVAHMSGVEINVMLPGIGDKRIVYAATMSYAKNLVEIGINVYLYNGFLHSKAIIVDDEIVTIGTCNTDNRSFALNFEINAFMFNKEFAEKNSEIFKTDLENCTKLNLTYFKRKPFYTRLAQAFYRLFSPLL